MNTDLLHMDLIFPLLSKHYAFFSPVRLIKACLETLICIVHSINLFYTGTEVCLVQLFKAHYVLMLLYSGHVYMSNAKAGTQVTGEQPETIQRVCNIKYSL